MQQQPSIWCPGVNLDHPLAQGLVAAWPFWEGSGSRVGDCLGKDHGAITGATWTRSRDGQALNWALSNEKITLVSDIVCGSGDALTIMLWMNPTNLSALRGLFGDDQGILGSRVLISSTTIYFCSDGGSVQSWSKAISTGSWHQFVLSMTYDDPWWALECFVDGLSIGTKSFAVASDSFVLKLLGYFGDDTYEWSGLLCNAMVWARVLHAGEISLLWERPWLLYERRNRLPLWVAATSVTAIEGIGAYSLRRQPRMTCQTGGARGVLVGGLN